MKKYQSLIEVNASIRKGFSKMSNIKYQSLIEVNARFVFMECIKYEK